MVLATISEMAAEGHVEVTREDRQRSPLVLVARNEGLTLACEGLHDIDWPPRQGPAVLER